MLRHLLPAFAALILFAGAALAEEVTAKVTKVDAEKRTLVVDIDGAEKTFTVAKDAEVYTQAKAKNKPGPKTPLPGGLGALKEGSSVTLSTFRSGEKEIVSAIRFEGAVRKKKDK